MLTLPGTQTEKKIMSKILIVDDNNNVCFLLKSFLEEIDYDVLTSNNGKDALIKAKKEKPDIILLDIRMPDMDGLEILWNIRKRDKEVCIIMVTAIDEEDTGLAAKRLGADDYITKPIKLDHLHKCIQVDLIKRNKEKLKGTGFQFF